ncbi:unnamed protein product [Ceutorhynchus assimilis]|uniref:SWIM-type domain-containing protein n=1 Tax=Ceutorhynchus assimilis TaxID=467358 RepID=A0A9N9QLT2_9CUCU|nr:unnamed protein product [Ceutorhynchus assimilis]
MSGEDVLNEVPGAELEALLPDGYEYLVVDAKPISDNKFIALFHIDLKSDDEIFTWLDKYQQRNHIYFEEVDNDDENFVDNEFIKVYRCVASTFSNAEEQSIQCEATIKTTLKKVNMENSSDQYLETYPCEIVVTHFHNHELNFSIPKFQHWFEDLFQEGQSPKSALKKIREELLQKYGEDYLEIDPTAKICLCQSWVNDYYSTLYGEPNMKEEYSELEKIIHEYNDECGDICAMVKNESIIAICSPLMKRNWELISEVKEVIYVDSSVLDKHNMRIMSLLCPSRLGILPLGILLLPCKDDDEEFIIEGINLLRLMLPENAKTPKLMIVADRNEGRCNLLKDCFNIENVLICKIFVQKTVLKWLWSQKNRLTKAERINIYVTFIKTLNCSTETEFEESYEKLTAISNNTKTYRYFENLKAMAPLWATCYRKSQKYDSNDYSKIIFNVLQKNMPAKTLNKVQLFACVASNFENYFFNWLTKLTSSNGLASEQTESWQGCSSSVFDCRDIGDNLYSVMEDTKINIVNRSIDYCTCSVNQNRVPCRHKWAIIRAFNFKDDVHPLVDEKLKRLIKKLLVGNKCILKGWYDDNKKLDQLDTDYAITRKISKQPRMKEIQNKLENTVKTIMQKLVLNPNLFIGPVEKFISDFESCKTNDDLVNVLASFSKPKVASTPIAKKVTAGSNSVKKKSVVIKAQQKLTPIGRKQNSAGYFIFKEMQRSDLVIENNFNSINKSESGPVKKKKMN